MVSVGSIIKCLISTTGKIGNRASVSIENAVVDLPALSENDVEALMYCARAKVSFVIIPKVQNADVVREVKKMLGT